MKKSAGRSARSVVVRVRLGADLAASLRRMELAEAAFGIEENARTLPESLRWLAMQAVRTGNINPCVLHVAVKEALAG